MSDLLNKQVNATNEHRYSDGSLAFQTVFKSERFVRSSPKPSPLFNEPPYATEPYTVYRHDETLVTVEALCCFCSYSVFFRSDGTVESRTFS